MTGEHSVQAISDWLIDQGLLAGDYDDVLVGFNERLNTADIPVVRSMLAMRTLHPTIDARSLIWRCGHPLDHEDFVTEQGPSDNFLQSPLAALLADVDLVELHRPLTGPDAELDFPVLHEFVSQGLTDYLIFKVPFPVASLQEIDAVILFMDLRGFTALADAIDGARMAKLLNAYFEHIVPEIVGRGGEILKYGRWCPGDLQPAGSQGRYGVPDRPGCSNCIPEQRGNLEPDARRR